MLTPDNSPRTGGTQPAFSKLELPQTEVKLLQEIASQSGEISISEDSLHILRSCGALLVVSAERYQEMGSQITAGRSSAHLIEKLNGHREEMEEELRAHEETAPSEETLLSLPKEGRKELLEPYNRERNRILEAQAKLNVEIASYESARREAESLRTTYDNLVCVEVKQGDETSSTVYVQVTEQGRQLFSQ